ncbi:MAG: fibro-slime domain-containing protein [Fibrobacter sp.]|nr:fibro-slime domain-containing protein [Fibrobacter sp.]
MRISELFYRVIVCLAILSACAFAQTVAIAHIIYDGNVLYYADNESNFVYKSLEKGGDGTFTIEFSDERLADGKKDVRRLQFGLGCNGNTCHTDLSPDNKPLLGELFPQYKENSIQDGKYIYDKSEIWIVINDDKTLTISQTKPVVTAKPKIFIRFLTPWTNTNAIMYLNDTESYMSSVGSPYCGWFQSSITKKSGSVSAYFKQTIGTTYIGAEGSTEDESTVQPIKLDSAIALSDTVWIVAYPYGAPEIHTDYPGVLGECLPKILPVMMFDWYDGSMNSDGSKDGLYDHKKGAGRTGFDARGVPMFGTGVSEDFGQGGCEGSPMTGMVEKQLGPNGVPVMAKNFPSGCKNSTHLNSWFLPEVVAEKNGQQYTNVTCRDLELTLTDDGFWLGQKDDESPERGLFFLDDFRWLDEAKTVENPHYDSITGGNDIPGEHNYGFAMKIQAEFVYVKGQYFEFNGDDDVWVFINNQLVVDIGGQHRKIKKSVNLDDLHLTPGETYPFHIFYAERKRTQSNFMMRTSIDLKVESSMFLTDHSTDSTLIKKEVWQNIREKKLACDFSADSDTKRTERGPSNFTLFGKSLPLTGVALAKQDTIYYNGIAVTNDFTMLTINTTTISRTQSLPPGTYYVRISLKNNPKEFKDVYFTIPPTELPNIAFADIIDSSYCFIADVVKQDTLCVNKYWKPLGTEASRDISSDTLPINLNKNEKLWAGRIYPINVTYVEEWAHSYSGMAVQVSTSDTKLVPCDSVGSPLPNNEFVLIEGKNTFYVKATGAVVNGTLTISSTVAKNKSVKWTNINIAEPPVPQIETSFIYDRNGDGRGDSVWIKFSKPLGGSSVLDSLKFTFLQTHHEQSKVTYKDGESVLTVVAEGDGFGTAISTGGATEPYNGKITVYYTYTNPQDRSVSIFSVDGVLGDGIGPIIMAAEIGYTEDGKTMLTLTLSEGLDSKNAASSMFAFRCYGGSGITTDIQEADYVSAEPANKWKLIFSKKSINDVLPIVGDSVRIKPPSEGGIAVDLNGLTAHEKNPWVRITGEQRITVTSPPVVTMDKESPNFEKTKEIVRSDSATVPILVTSDKPLTATQVGEIYGTQGHYMGDMNMSELVENEITEIAKTVKTSTMLEDKEAVKNGSAATSISLEAVITMMDRNQITPKDAKNRYGLSDVIINAYDNGLLTKDNLHNYIHGTPEDVKTIAESMADRTALSYKTTYFTSLGQFVNSDAGQIACNDDIFKTDGAVNCLGNNGHLYLAWNMRSKDGRLAGTGVYIARLEIRLIVNGKKITKRTQDFLWGFRHGNLAIVDFDMK